MKARDKRTSGGATPPSPASAREPSYDEIARRAYEIYLRRGGGEDRAIEDWLQAERELREERRERG